MHQDFEFRADYRLLGSYQLGNRCMICYQNGYFRLGGYSGVNLNLGPPTSQL